VRLAAATRPDVVLMDLRMPGVDGVAATVRIAAGEAGEPAPRVLILTTYESDDQILAAIEAGASGYLLKAAPRDEIIAGIRSVAAGQTALSPRVAVALVQRMR
jgi:DNA-binding NarL/FixJ family response regulator